MKLSGVSPYGGRCLLAIPHCPFGRGEVISKKLRIDEILGVSPYGGGVFLAIPHCPFGRGEVISKKLKKENT
jgi:hypothetical protein